MTERKTKTDHTGKRIRNFVVVQKTKRKKQRADGRNLYLYKCQCDCGKKFEATAAQFEYIFGCKDCSKQHHYELAVKNATTTKLKNPSRRTPLSKLYPESYGGIRGSYANYVINWIKSTATKRGLVWDLDPIEAFDLIRKPCHYCGTTVKFPETRNGLDRIDNTKGYIKDNVVSCCYPCNIAKHEMSAKEFKLHIIKVFEHWACQ